MREYEPGTNEAPTRQESDSLEPTRRRSDKPAIVHLVNGEQIVCDHHIRNDTGVAVVVDRESTDSGIDLVIPHGRIMAIQKTQTRAGNRALGKIMGWD